MRVGLGLEYRVSPCFWMIIVYPLIRLSKAQFMHLLQCVVRNEIDEHLVPILGLICRHGRSS